MIKIKEISPLKLKAAPAAETLQTAGGRQNKEKEEAGSGAAPESRFKKAFTLAEVLITLTIIGVIAAMTITIIIGSYQKSYTISQLQKLFSVFEQGFRAAAAFNYESKYWNVSTVTSGEESHKFFEKYIQPYFKIYKDCGTSDENGCDFTFRDLKGVEKKLDDKWTKFFLNDGSFIGITTAASEGYKAVYIYMDINGKKPLNVLSRDVFYFEYLLDNVSNPYITGKMLPFGYEIEKDNLMTGPHACSAEGDGYYCGALIMKDSWQILEHYPWSRARYALNPETPAASP